MLNSKLAAFAVSRRCVGVAVFAGTHLDYTKTRTLSSSFERADESALSFVQWTISTFEVDSVALQLPQASRGMRPPVLYRLILEFFRREGIPVWEVNQRTLLAAFALPPPKKRHVVRAITRSFWPILSGEGDAASVDAAALGLYVQTQRLLGF